MKRFIASGLMLLLAAGCLTTFSGPDVPVLTDFSSIDQYVGKDVVVRGIISETHEASGLYLTQRDLIEENESCIVPRPMEGFSHGERVTLSGRLERTDCGLGRICTNVCDRYVLVRGQSTGN